MALLNCFSADARGTAFAAGLPALHWQFRTTTWATTKAKSVQQSSEASEESQSSIASEPMDVNRELRGRDEGRGAETAGQKQARETTVPSDDTYIFSVKAFIMPTTDTAYTRTAHTSREQPRNKVCPMLADAHCSPKTSLSSLGEGSRVMSCNRDTFKAP